jgi:phage portal protein BeeE
MGLREFLQRKILGADAQAALSSLEHREAGFYTQGFEDAIAILQKNMQAVGSVPFVADKSTVRQKFHRWMYAAATAVADAVAMVELYIEVEEKDGWTAVAGHDCTALLARPNPQMSGAEWRYLVACDLMLVGESHWHIIEEGGKPTELWPIVGKVTAEFDSEGSIKKWKQEYHGEKGKVKTETYEPEEVLFLRLPKPGALVGGYGPGEAVISNVNLDMEIIKTEWAAFKEGIMPRPILKQSDRDPARRELTRKKFSDLYAGSDKSAEAISISKDMDLIFPTRTARDMGFTDGANRMKEAILATFRVPEAILGVATNVSRAAAEAVEYIFAKHRTVPLLYMMSEGLTIQLVRPYWGEKERVGFDSPVPADRRVEIQEVRALALYPIMTPNEIRAQYFGLPGVPWGERPFVSRGLVQLGPQGEIEGPSGTDTSPEDDTETDETDNQAAQGATIAAYGVRERRAISIAFREHKREFSGILEGKVVEIFRKLTGDVLEALERTFTAERRGEAGQYSRLELPPDIDRLLTPSLLAEEMARELKPYNRKGLFLGGSFDATVVAGRGPFIWNEELDEIRRYATEFGSTHYIDVARTTRERYVATVLRAVERDAGWAETRKTIVDEFGSMAESRAANIATTESTKLYGAGGQAFRDANSIGKKSWVCSFVNSRDSHISADGQTVRNSEFFSVGGDRMMFPGDGALAEENCNCNCCAVAVVT